MQADLELRRQEAEAAIDAALKPMVQRDDLAREVYAAFCNVAWVPIESNARTYDEAHDEALCLAMSWRYAGGWVADLRPFDESYMDFYCSGNEGVVSEAVRAAMEAVGYRPVTSK
jgi:hypothetical protein